MEFLDQLIRVTGDIPQIQEARTRIGLFLMFTQDHIFGNREVFDHAIPHPLFRNVGKHTVSDVARGEVGHILAFQDHTSTRDLAQAGDRFGQLRVDRCPKRQRHPGLRQNTVPG